VVETNPINRYSAGSDESFMHEALVLAQDGLGWTSPNPLVGCVLVRDGEIIGRGYHAQDGEEHAEVRALREAGDARGATAYVSLEPCSHVARQPSCCHKLAEAGVSRVVWGALDVDPRSAGRAEGTLRGLGLTDIGRALVPECEQFLDYYLISRRRQRAFAHLKLALSLDGKLACRTGHSQWLSGPQSLGYAHYLRLKYDAVLVGYRTVLADNPRLTVRPDVLTGYDERYASARLRQPARVVLDPRCVLLPRLTELALAQVENGEFRSHLPRLVLVCRAEFAPASFGVPNSTVMTLDAPDGQPLSFDKIFRQLWNLGLGSVLIEGGGRLAAELLRQQAADKLSLVYTPLIIGADGVGFSPELQCEQVADCLRISATQPRILGRDVLMEGTPVWLMDQ